MLGFLSGNGNKSAEISEQLKVLNGKIDSILDILRKGGSVCFNNQLNKTEILISFRC